MNLNYVNNRFHRLSITLILALFLASGCEDEKNATNSRKRSAPDHYVSVSELTLTPISLQFTRTGTVDLHTRTILHSQTEGKIINIPWHEGDKVNKNATLVKLDDALLKAELNKAKAELNQALLDLKRVRNLRKSKAISDEELTRKQTELNIAKAEVDLINTRLEHTTVTAPYDGIVTQKHAEQNQVVNKNSPLITMIDPGSRYIKTQVSELLLPQIKESLPVQVKIDAFEQASINPLLAGKIYRIHPVINQQTRQAIVEISLDHIPDNLQPGQFARIEFTSSPVKRLLLPFSAVQYDRASAFIYMYRDQKAVKTSIKTGQKFGEKIEVLAGLEPGMKVITKGFLGLTNSKAVKTNEK